MYYMTFKKVKNSEFLNVAGHKGFSSELETCTCKALRKVPEKC